MTKTLIQEIESVIGDIVYFSNAYTEHYSLYVNEANKPSKDYNHSIALQSFDRAHSYARMAIQSAKDAGLEPDKVCRDCMHFMDAYKKIA